MSHAVSPPRTPLYTWAMQASDKQPAATKRRRRPRISLLTLLLLVTVCVLAGGLWRASYSILPLSEEIDRLKREVGDVAVENPEHMHLQLGPSLNIDRYVRYRVYIPPDHVGLAVLNVKVEDRGKATHNETVSMIHPGESTVEMLVSRSAVGDFWTYKINTIPGCGGIAEGPMPPWYDDYGKSLGIAPKETPTGGVGDGESLDLIRQSTVREDGSAVEVVLTITMQPMPERLSP